MNGVVGLRAPRGGLACPVPRQLERGPVKALTRVRIGQVPLDLGRLEDVLPCVERLVLAGQGGCVLTPGVEQVVRAEHDALLREALATADLSLAGSTALLRAAAVLGVPSPEARAGADWLPPLAELARQRAWRVLVVAERPGIAEWASGALRDRYGLLAVGVAAQDLPAERLLERIALTRPDLVLVSLATPQQELFCQSAAERLGTAVVVGLGAALESLVDARRRGRSRGVLARVTRWLSQRWTFWRVLARARA